MAGYRPPVQGQRSRFTKWLGGLPATDAGEWADYFKSQIPDPRGTLDLYRAAMGDPIDAFLARGKFAPGLNAGVAPMMGIPLGGRWAPKMPGYRAEVAQRGDRMINFEGLPERFRRSNEDDPYPGSRFDDEPDWDSMYESNFESIYRGYNIKDPAGNVMASAKVRRFPVDRGKKVFVDSMWVDPSKRNTRMAFDLLNLITHGGKLKPTGVIANDKLYRVARKMERRQKHEEAQRAGRAQETRDLRAAVNPIRQTSQSELKQLQIALHQERLKQQPVRNVRDVIRKYPEPVANRVLPPAMRVKRPTNTRGGR